MEFEGCFLIEFFFHKGARGGGEGGEEVGGAREDAGLWEGDFAAIQCASG